MASYNPRLLPVIRAISLSARRWDGKGTCAEAQGPWQTDRQGIGRRLCGKVGAHGSQWRCAVRRRCIRAVHLPGRTAGVSSLHLVAAAHWLVGSEGDGMFLLRHPGYSKAPTPAWYTHASVNRVRARARPAYDSAAFAFPEICNDAQIHGRADEGK